MLKTSSAAATSGSMEGEGPAHAECQQSASRSIRPKNHQVSFTTSTFRLQNASQPQDAAWLESQPLCTCHTGTSGAGPPLRTAAASFSLRDEGSSSPMPSTAKQPGLEMSSAAEGRKGTREEFDMSYVFSEGPEEKGVVPLITVGSVFSIFKRREVFTPPGVSVGTVLLQALQHKKASSIKWLRDDMKIGTQVAMQDGKVMSWVTPEAAKEAQRSREVFREVLERPAVSTSPDGRSDSGRSSGKQPIHSKEGVRPKKEDSSSATVRKAFPRPPSFLLPKHFWLPGAKPPTEPSSITGVSGDYDPANVYISSKEVVGSAPLVHMINALKGTPPECGFQLEPDQEKSALDTHAAWQRTQQALSAKNPEEASAAAGSSIDSASNGSGQRTLISKTGAINKGEMPVFRLPGVQIRLPTAVGIVSFSPLFLSKEQLDRTWGAIRAVHWRWLMRQRRRERRQLRLSIEQLAAGLAGVRAGPPALPPASASASAARPGEEEDEEGMDEPPEVKQFLQELGEGGRAAQEPGLPEDGLPASGVGFALVSCATGTLSLGMRCVEQVCNQAERLFSLTPVGKQALGFLPDPLISVHSLGALAERTNAQNMRVLYGLAQEGAFGPGIDVTPASEPEEASSADSTTAQSAASEQGLTGLSEGGVRDDATPEAQDSALGPDQGNGPSSSTDGAATSAHSISSTDAVRHGQGMPEHRSGGHSSGVEQRDVSPHKRSRLGIFLGRLRRRKHARSSPAATQFSESMQNDSSKAGPQSSDHSSSEAQQHSLERSAVEQLETAAAGPKKMPKQLKKSSAPAARHGKHEGVAATPRAASSAASESLDSENTSSSMKAAEEAQGEQALTVLTDEGTELPDVRLDWAVMNESMMHSLHSFVTTLTTALIAQSLGMQVMGVPGLKRPRGSSRGSAGNQQQQRSSSAGADSEAPDVVPDHDLDRAIVPFQESAPTQQEGAAAAGAGQYGGDMEIIFNADKVAGLEMDQDEEEKTLKGLLMVGHLDIDPKGEEMPWPIPAIGFGNGAHLARAELRCASEMPHGKAT